jgi:hypothetical protein
MAADCHFSLYFVYTVFCLISKRITLRSASDDGTKAMPNISYSKLCCNTHFERLRKPFKSATSASTDPNLPKSTRLFKAESKEPTATVQETTAAAFMTLEKLSAIFCQVDPSPFLSILSIVSAIPCASVFWRTLT